MLRSMNPVEIIRKKRDGETLTQGEVSYFVRGVADGSIADYQIAAFLMAYYFQDMVVGNRSNEELAWFTQGVADSGDRMDFSDDFPLLFDKHSTGGVGDKLSFICAPLMAACGCPSLLLSGRGLGHTGGTLDKMEAVAGTRAYIEKPEIAKILKKVGLVICGQTGSIAPADKKLYALRDVTATVPSIGLIAASILGKKMAVSPTCLVLDVKVGAGAFMKTEDDGRRLAATMLGILKTSGRPASVLLTRMEQPLGRMVGNALEIREVLQALSHPKGTGLNDILEIGCALATEAVMLGGRLSREGAHEKVQAALDSGAAYEKFIEFMVAQGSDQRLLREPERLPSATERIPLFADRTGFIAEINSYEIGIASNLLGAGRFRAEDEVDPAVGIELRHKTGAAVKAGDELCVLHVNGRARLDEAGRRAAGAFAIAEQAPRALPGVMDAIRQTDSGGQQGAAALQ